MLRLKDKEEWSLDEVEKHFRQTDCICASSAATNGLGWNLKEHVAQLEVTYVVVSILTSSQGPREAN